MSAEKKKQLKERVEVWRDDQKEHKINGTIYHASHGDLAAVVGLLEGAKMNLPHKAPRLSLRKVLVVLALHGFKEVGEPLEDADRHGAGYFARAKNSCETPELLELIKDLGIALEYDADAIKKAVSYLLEKDDGAGDSPSSAPDKNPSAYPPAKAAGAPKKTAAAPMKRPRSASPAATAAAPARDTNKDHLHEYAKFETENAKLETENAKLKAKTAKLKAEYAKKLKPENAKLKAENAKLKAEYEEFKARLKKLDEDSATPATPGF